MGLLKRQSKKALEVDVRAGGANLPGDWLYQDNRGQISDLLYRIDEILGRKKSRIVQFISSGAREGTSSVAHAYASASADVYKRNVLLLTNSGIPSAAAPDAAQNTAATPSSQRLLNAVRSLSAHLSAAELPLDDEFARQLALNSAENSLWSSLHNHFDEIVVDSPALSKSLLGRLIAAQADAVIVVVEAEKAREPVVRKLVEDLHSVRANVIGTVLNKRKFYVPASIYERL